MKTMIKKAQNGIKAKPVTVTRLRQVADSLDNVASQKMQASMNRTTEPGGSYDDIAQKLNKQSGKNSSDAKRYRKLADASEKKAKTKKKMKNGGSLKPVAANQKGLAKLPTPVRNKMGYAKNGAATKMKMGGMCGMKAGGKIKAKQ